MSDTQFSVSTGQYRALQHDPVIVPRPDQLFDYVVETLAARSLLRYADAERFRGALPSGLFLLVPPLPESARLEDLMALVEFGGVRGRSLIDERDLAGSLPTPEGPYLLIDVEDGHRSTGRPAALAPGRLPFVIWEGIVHAILFPMVFESHDLVLVGSTLRSGAVPTLCLHGGRAELRGYWHASDGYPRHASPSCALRAGAPETSASDHPERATSPA